MKIQKKRNIDQRRKIQITTTSQPTKPLDKPKPPQLSAPPEKPDNWKTMSPRDKEHWLYKHK
jgi:hypothetical protein